MKENTVTEKEKLMNPRKEDARAISGLAVKFVNPESLEQAIEHIPLALGDSKVSHLLTGDSDRDADALCGDDICGEIRSGTVKGGYSLFQILVNRMIILGIQNVLG
ncbi:MAG: hypothetical protein ALECFALPRED_004187 [Alectoria fallacina]|uniref:Uncharacterized protein n=1 Tax=Alectoria fallacina TaxID=1903189 RepID=A0A8H3FTU3_9LECA|nr:MAG: hypothetical protein ALECFALPRED_004187 [Alectoria fallacina]